ncbi:MAG: hypothetical protein M3Y30_13515 [Gemmatimonadota bacterium]|nr:hypothetical protein [Gemmatimonadota bacterium]
MTTYAAINTAAIHAGKATIELSSATPEQVAAIAQALARSTCDPGTARGARVLRNAAPRLHTWPVRGRALG